MEKETSLWFYGGGLHTWKATSAETGGTFILFEDVMTRGKVTPLHTHPVDETMIMLQGEVPVHMEGEEYVQVSTASRWPLGRTARIHGHLGDGQDVALGDPGEQ